MMEQHQDATQPKRCAIYTRKSSEAGLEQSFNSLHAQREACEAYIKSQAHERWKLRPTQYDDGGISGGTMERPALQQLIHDIESDLIDVVVVYKVDRLSRSLADFARMVEMFEQNNVSFVSVTQHFNTSSSMGRLTLNVLLSFAQFEREVTGERIRDKIAASKKKGMWMGGRVPLGYDVSDKQMLPNKAEAKTVQHIYERYLALGCVRRLKAELDDEGYISKVRKNGVGGKSFSRGALYGLLRNPVYVGKVGHKGEVYEGQHEPILARKLWEQVQQQLERNRSEARRRSAAKAPSLLAGLLFDNKGHPMSPTHSTKGKKRYRYYISQAVLKFVESDGGDVLRVPAKNVESVVLGQIKDLLLNSEIVLLTAKQLGIPGEQWSGLLNKTATLAEQQEELSPSKKIEFCSRILNRVVLGRDHIECHFNIPALIEDLIPTETAATIEGTQAVNNYSVTTPVHSKRCRLETRLVSGDRIDQGTHAGSIKAIRTALENAQRWNQALLQGKVSTLTELARSENLDQRYLSDLIKLAFLAPDIQSAITEGTLPASMTLDQLKSQVPACWDKQKKIVLKAT